MAMQPRHPLAALIDHVRSVNNWSDPDVVNRARQRGHLLSKSNISRIRNEDVTTIKGSMIKALAAGLGLDVLTVADAALESMGIKRYDIAQADSAQAIRTDPALSEKNRAMLLALLQEMYQQDVKGVEHENLRLTQRFGYELGRRIGEAEGLSDRNHAPGDDDSAGDLPSFESTEERHESDTPQDPQPRPGPGGTERSSPMTGGEDPLARIAQAGPDIHKRASVREQEQMP